MVVHIVSSAVGILLEPVRGSDEFDAPGNRASRRRGGSLLRDMRDLMSEHLEPRFAVRPVVLFLEDDVVSHGIRVSSENAGRFRRLFVSVYPHAGQIEAETILETRPDDIVKRPSAGGHDGGHKRAGPIQHPAHVGVAGLPLKIENRACVQRSG
jgi:hypothetical protein